MDDKEKIRRLQDHLKVNKMSFAQFIMTADFVRDMAQEDMNMYIKAYLNGEFKECEIFN